MTNKTPALNCAGRLISFDRPALMGVINITPDSFSDGGQMLAGRQPALSRILRRAESMCREGAVFLDVGGESTRPGAQPVSVSEEMDRVMPVVDALVSNFDAVVSVDTSSPQLMSAAVTAGAGLVNDVRALNREAALEAVAATSAAVCVMHMSAEPGVMQDNPAYDDVVLEVRSFLEGAVARCRSAGIADERIMIDPGFGFGKTLQHNLQLFNGLARLCETPWPVLVGVSRKSMIGKLTGRSPRARVAGGVALATLAAQAGAAVIRTHDVAATRDALLMVQALRETNKENA